ncbi:membrane cofactor protein [Anabrus simplex]|uniref:membrane cofactor protein n=1 Tax=Anabrus simplex TaxID=316456 RepID=UPI0034DDC74E
MKQHILIIFTSIFLIIEYCKCELVKKNRTEINRGLSFSADCPDYGEIEHGMTLMENNGIPALRIQCDPDYDLIGRPKILCNDGQWENIPRPQCAKRCPSPPFMRNAEVHFEGRNDDTGTYRKGTLAAYRCVPGFELVPPNSKLRECKDGVWTGIQGVCVSNGCSAPANIANGYYVLETPQGNIPDNLAEHKQVHVSQRAHYNCYLGFVLSGVPTMQCIETGEWSPRIPPQCIPQPQLTEDPSSQLCSPAPSIPHTTLISQEGVRTSNNADLGARIEVRCEDGYRDPLAPCAPFSFTCEGGEWKGRVPNCLPVNGCLPPPSIPHGALFGLAGDGVYQIHAQVAYTCPPGYVLQGDQMLSCSPSGCWEPTMLPVCRLDPQFFVSPRTLAEYLSTGGILLISTATVVGVMLILLVVCLVVVGRRRAHRPWRSMHHHRSPYSRGSTTTVGVNSEAASSPGGVAPASIASSASNTLMHDPDRVALIAYADGVQLGESALPSYEEAVRERAVGTGAPGGLLSYRSHGRPHWTALGAARRARGPDAVHVTRQSSSTSHSVSTGDSMGSTDTMAPSEVSTNVTLDTCSSGSQTASCRAICGSLASFDTSSVLNTEGVPLLEENELEDGALPALGLDAPDCGSFKYRRTSPDLA